jgi:hypothetical protein
MQIQIVNTWYDETVSLLTFDIHNCGNCAGIEICLLGIALSITFEL